VSKLDEILEEAKQLLEKGMNLQIDASKKNDLGSLNMLYQVWYTKALAVVKQLTPERTLDFIEAYKLDRRKAVTYDTYTISDYLMGLVP
jgi:hypothetical protein